MIGLTSASQNMAFFYIFWRIVWVWKGYNLETTIEGKVVPEALVLRPTLKLGGSSKSKN